MASDAAFLELIARYELILIRSNDRLVDAQNHLSVAARDHDLLRAHMRALVDFKTFHMAGPPAHDGPAFLQFVKKFIDNALYHCIFSDGSVFSHNGRQVAGGSVYISAGYNNPVLFFSSTLTNSFEAELVSAYLAVKESLSIPIPISHLAVVLDNSAAVSVFNIACRGVDYGAIYAAAPNLRHEISAAIIPLIARAATHFTSLIALHVPAHTSNTDDFSEGNREADRLARYSREIADLTTDDTANYIRLVNPIPGSELSVNVFRNA